MLTIELLGSVKNTDTAIQALRSFSDDPADSPSISPQILGDTQQLAALLPKNPSRNVFLWMLDVILEITAPVYWWIQIGQYDVDIFTLRRQDHDQGRLLSDQDFEGAVTRQTLAVLNNYIRDGQPDLALKLLPTNFIQRGYIKISYMSLKRIYHTESPSTDGNWGKFREFIESLPHHELITEQR